HGELCARADGEVRGMRRVAKQDDVVVEPMFVSYSDEVHPRRLRLVHRVEQQGMAFEPLSEHALASGDGLLSVHLVKTRVAPGELVAFHNKCGMVLVEAVAVR